MKTALQLEKLRHIMFGRGIDYYFIPTRDDHNNEYVPPHWQRRAWLSEFTGSYGELLVGLQSAYLWTDSRYALQAESEVDAQHIHVTQQVVGQGSPISAWLVEHVHNAIVSVDPRVMSIAQQQQWSQLLQSTHSELTPIPDNLVDLVWENRPKHVFQHLHIYDEKYAGQLASEKLNLLRQAMQKNRVDYFIVSQLDEIAWLFNIRGNDVPYNPLLMSYAIIEKNNATLFLHLPSVSSQQFPYFEKNHIALKPYEHFEEALQKLSGRVWVDPKTTSWWVALQCDRATLIEKESPIVMMKAIKNKIESQGMRQAHCIDAIAMIQFLHWLENHWRDGVNEVVAADQLEKFRRSDARCRDLSFPTICGFADHGAIVHYRAEPNTAHIITDKNLLLIDSGGQYFEGTTDITRTIHLGTPTDEQKKHYTLVLKGHLQLGHAIFPKGVMGEHLDALARAPLWQEKLDYGHGTGHGVGCYLCVHEGPQRISYGASGVALQPGMMVSNEPGVYFAKKYGIRIENVCEIIEAGENFLTMRDLTMVPYARNLIDCALLTPSEIQWINEYHHTIFSLLEKIISPELCVWLAQATESISVGSSSR